MRAVAENIRLTCVMLRSLSLVANCGYVGPIVQIAALQFTIRQFMRSVGNVPSGLGGDDRSCGEAMPAECLKSVTNYISS